MIRRGAVTAFEGCALFVLRVVLVAVTVVVLVGCGSGGVAQPLRVTVINDGTRTVELQPSCGVLCHPFEPAVLRPGASYTWHTIDREPGIQTFGVHIPHGRSLGCIGQRGGDHAGGSVTFRVSMLEECVS
jgi:hypothetical protein